jgi:hypothetical protein
MTPTKLRDSWVIDSGAQLWGVLDYVRHVRRAFAHPKLDREVDEILEALTFWRRTIDADHLAYRARINPPDATECFDCEPYGSPEPRARPRRKVESTRNSLPVPGA